MTQNERTKLSHRLLPMAFAQQPRYSERSLPNKTEEVSVSLQHKFNGFGGSLESTNDDFSGTLTKNMDSLDANIKELTRIEMSKSQSFRKTLTAKIEQMLSEIEFEQKSGEVMDAQEILDLNKDILRKRLEDPFSIFYKHLLELHAAHSQILQEIQLKKKCQHQILRKNDDIGSISSKRVVLLKPVPSTTSSMYSSSRSWTNSMKQQKSTAHFPIRDIQKKLKNMMCGSTKMRFLISKDGVLHKIPYGCQIFRSNDCKNWNCSKFFKRGNTRNVEPSKHKSFVPSQKISPNINARHEVSSLPFEESSVPFSGFSFTSEKEATMQMSEEEGDCSGSSAESISFSMSDSSLQKVQEYDDEKYTTAGKHKGKDCEYPHSNTFTELAFAEQDSDVYISTSHRHNETRYDYIKSVLETSGVSKEHLENIQPSRPLLNQSVFEEVEILYDQLVEDSKLLFDCIEEVLKELKYKYIVSSPWMSVIKSNVRPFPVGDSFVNEVCDGVEKHFDIVVPYTVDTMIGKDLESEPWVDDWVEVDCAVVGIGNDILEYVMEETILELWE